MTTRNDNQLAVKAKATRRWILVALVLALGLSLAAVWFFSSLNAEQHPPFRCTENAIKSCR